MTDDRYFSADPAHRKLAADLYAPIRGLPLICPHGHVDPRLFADPEYTFGTPVDMLIIPDHYIFRMLYSQGIPLESLGIPRKDGGAAEQDHRKIWQTVCDHWHLFRGTPTGIWLRDELRDVFEIDLKLNSANAQAIYDALSEKLAMAAYKPRALYDKFNIEVLATTDAATDTLTHHQAARDSWWRGKQIIPTFRPDGVVNLDTAGWKQNIELLGEVSGVDVRDFKTFIAALEQRREFFRSMGATATDHAAMSAYTEVLDNAQASAIFQRAMRGDATAEDATRFTGHMLIEMARMSSEDGLVMQLHVGSYRNHNPALFAAFGRDMGADIPLAVEFTHSLRPLLNRFGTNPRVSIILFNLDETNYSRELAPLAGHYPALRLGPPWWFFDSWNGMRRYFESVIETAGIYNTAGFNDDTRAYPSIPARHDVWRRASADWVADLLIRGMIDEEDAREIMLDLTYRLAKRAYNL